MSFDVNEELLRIEAEPRVSARVAKLRDLTIARPTVARIWLRLAHAAALDAQHDVAFAALENALCLDLQASGDTPPNLPQPLAERVEAMRYVAQIARRGDPVHELDALRRLSLRYPDYAPLLFNHSVALANHGDFEEARRAAACALRQSPTIHRLFPPVVARLLDGRGVAAVRQPSPAPPSDPHIGRLYGSYRVVGIRTWAPEHVLYDGVDTRDHSPVTLRRHCTLGAHSARRLFADQASATHHARHIVRVLGVVEADDGSPFQVLERVHGLTVWEAMQSPPEDLDVALNLAWLAARAIHELHSRDNYLHGNIGPGMVMLLDDNIERPILFLDSGLDLRRRMGGSLPLGNAPDATPGPAGDVYGLGRLLHYAMTGLLPPDDGVDDSIPSNPVGRAVRELLLRCLNPDPNARCRRAEDVATKLETLFFNQSQPLVKGVELDEWYLEDRISDTGAYAEIYRARHRHQPSRYAALKVLRDSPARNRDLRFRFELEAARTPEHPGIVRILPRASFMRGAPPYFAMELLEGKSLADTIACGPLRLSDVVTYGLELSDALAFAHSSNMTHRDIKPDNMFVLAPGRDRHVKVLDFGVAKMPLSTIRTAMHLSVGTPAYMAPEQFVRPDQVGHEVDVYALGVVLVEALTGRHPGQGNVLLEQWSAYHQHTPVLVPGSLARVSGASEIERLLIRMTAKVPAERPTMAGVCDAFRAISCLVPLTPGFPTTVIPRGGQAMPEFDTPYDRPITRAHPTAILILIDESGSMAHPFGGVHGVSKREAVAQIVNEYIDSLITTCLQSDGQIFDYYFVRILGFGGRGVRPLLADEWLSASQLDGLSTPPPGQSELTPVWVTPAASGQTPGGAALAAARGYLEAWSNAHLDSHPPVLFVVSDGDFSPGEDVGDAAAQIGAMRGPPLVLCAHISSTTTTSALFPSQLPEALAQNQHAATLWKISSLLPTRMRTNIQRSLRHQEGIQDGARGYMFNVTSPSHLRALFRGGTPRNH